MTQVKLQIRLERGYIIAEVDKDNLEFVETQEEITHGDRVDTKFMDYFEQ